MLLIGLQISLRKGTFEEDLKNFTKAPDWSFEVLIQSFTSQLLSFRLEFRSQ